MPGKIVFVGWKQAPRETGLIKVERWGPRELFARHAELPRSIVFFADAVETIEPDPVRVVLGPAISRALLCLGTCDTPMMRHVGRWTVAGFRHFVEPDRLLKLLSMRFARRDRPEIATEDWLGFRPESGSEAERFARAVTELAAFDVGSLNRDLHRSPTWVREALRAALGTSPREAIRRYRVTLARAEHAAGVSLDECAEVAQYADVPTMLRAFRALSDPVDNDGPRQ